MREIVFRAYDQELGLSEPFLLNYYPIWNGDTKPYWANLCKIEQFTGLTDKNGTKIFEGDIVGFTAENELWEPQYYEGTVYFCDGTFWVDCGKDSDDCDVLFTIGHAKLCDESLQIIGNIHDNPEILP